MINYLRVFFDVDWLCNRMIRAKHTLMVCVRGNEIKSQYTQKRRSRGFSMIELVLIMVIMSILTAVLIPTISSLTEHSKLVKAKADLTHIAAVIRDFKVKYGRWPTEISQVSESVIPKNERLDPWGKAYSIWNYKLVSVNYSENTPVVRISVQFRNSSLYVIGYSGSTGYILRTTDGGEHFITLIKKSGEKFDCNYQNIQDFQYNDFLCMRNVSDGHIYTFNTIKNELIDTGLSGKFLATPYGIWIYDTSTSKIYKTLDGGKTMSLSRGDVSNVDFYG
jgi:general secretion pathway protein G